MTTQQPLAAIFDMDGVLIDSYHAHHQSWRVVSERDGFDISEAAFARTFGRTSREVIAELWNDPDMPAQRIAQIDDAKESVFRDLISRDFPEMPGATRLLSDLRGSGWKIAVASSGPPKNVESAVKHFTDAVHPPGGTLFDAVVTGADVTIGKPHPQAFQLAADRLGVPPDRCIVLEDAAHGVRAADRAGMACVVIASTGHRREEYAGLRCAQIEPALGAYTPQTLARHLSEESPAKQ